jgi:hypothetical protein
MKAVSEYPPEIQETVRTLRKLQASIDRRDRDNERTRVERDTLIDSLIEGGMGPREAMGIVGLGRNAWYQRQRRSV